MSRKIAVVTGTRADYGIYSPVLRAIQEEPSLELFIIATGMHLSPYYGETVNLIKQDGFNIAATVDMLLQGAEGAHMAKSIGMGIIGMAQVFQTNRPDFVMVLGDRGEMLAAAIAAAHMNIPILHLHGGEVSGTIDESVRHAISKLAHIHFTATEKSKERLMRMGEDAWRVHCVGSPRLDTIIYAKLPDLEVIKKKYQLENVRDYYLLIYHPVTTEIDDLSNQINCIVSTLLEENTDIICILPNSDAGTDRIVKEYQKHKSDSIHLITNFSPLEYLTVLKNCKALIGNSSSGIIEAASYATPVINIGSRQNGRERPDNVLDVNPTRSEIKLALSMVNRVDFKQRLKRISNIYGDGHTSPKIVNIIKQLKIDQRLIQKQITY